MSEIPGDLKYAKSHEWVRLGEDGTATVGISDHAQAALGDLVFVDSPEVGAELAVGDACAVVESVKAASDVYSPVAGAVVAVNERLADSPELVNQEPYEGGWIMKIKLENPAALDDLLDAAAYEATLDE
jgi:glycine cleavage system H protein